MNKSIRNKFGLTERDMKTIRSVFKSFPEVKTVNLFGSRAKGNYRVGSDVDLAIMNRGVDSTTLSRIIGKFEESSLPYNIDLIDFTKLTKQDFIDHINRVGIPFFKQGEMVGVNKD